MMRETLSEFGTIRSFLWPIRGSECRKIVPMFIICFLICFNYSILRCMKDTVVVTNSGAEVIPFIKVWALLPMAVLLTFLFTKLSNRFSQERVMYMMTSGFLIFFALFAFVLNPYSESLHMRGTAEYLRSVLPIGCCGMISMLEYWTFTSFYVMSELWQGIVSTVLFWGFANEVTKISEARRFYTVLSVACNVAAICAGIVGNYFAVTSDVNDILGNTAWDQTMVVLIMIVIVSGVLAMGIFRWMNTHVLTDPSFDGLHLTRADLKTKKKPSIRESFAYLSNSKYLICIAIIVVGYNLVINLVEVIWKGQLGKLYPNPNDFNSYLNHLTTLVGIFSTILSFFMPRLMGRFGWTGTAMITPLILLVTSVGFFVFFFLQSDLTSTSVGMLGMTPLVLVVFFGGAQNCLSKAAKYSVFDTTKEMSFIPLSHEVKLKGKAAIDGVGSRLGKAGSSVIHQGLILFFGSIAYSAPYVAAILLVATVVWIGATRSLGRQFDEIVQRQDPSDLDIPLSTVKEEQPATA